MSPPTLLQDELHNVGGERRDPALLGAASLAETCAGRVSARLGGRVPMSHDRPSFLAGVVLAGGGRQSGGSVGKAECG
jgi:hypothetical protein